MPDTTEAFSRVKIDAQLRDVDWKIDDAISVRFEDILSDGTKADYVLCDRTGHALAVLEAKRSSLDPREGEKQGRHYANLLDVPFVFLSNGDDLWFFDLDVDAHPRRINTVFTQADLERKIAARTLKQDPLNVEIDKKVAGRDYQIDCIDTLCREINLGRRKMLVEMATGTGKTRMAAALIKRLFDAKQVTRVLFLVDRITLAKQAEDAFTEHVPGLPCYVMRSNRKFDDAKRITVATLQTMINEYPKLSSGYFDLIVTDECHRSIYGKWSGVLKHFDGIQIGLTATPCTISDAEDVPDPEDGKFIRDTLRFFEVDKPTYRYTLKEAVSEGYLVPYRIYKAQTVKTASKEGFEVKREEIDWSALSDEDRKELEELFGDDPVILVNPSALERKFTIPERNRAMVREFREILERGHVGTDQVRRAPMWGKTIVFAVTKAHARTLAQMFDDHFADKKPSPTTRYADYVVSDVSDGPTENAADIIKRFKNEEFPQILVSVNMLDTGFDAPEVVNLVMARFTESAILYRQMRGRGTRKAEHIKKVDFTMFDFVGVTDFHGDDDDMVPGGTGEPSAPPFKPAIPRRLIQLDVHDHIDPSTRDWVTLDDNGAIIYSDAHEKAAGALGLKFEAWLGAQEFDAEQMRLIRLLEKQIEADAEGLNEVGEWLLDEGALASAGGYPRAMTLFGGAGAVTALFNSLNSALFSDDDGSESEDGDAQPHGERG